MGNAESVVDSSWSMPDCQHAGEHITHWQTKSFSPTSPPPNFQHYQEHNSADLIAPLMNKELKGIEYVKEERKYDDEKLIKHGRALELWDKYMKAMGDAEKLQHPTNDNLQPWLWTCRLYARVPENDYADDKSGIRTEKVEVGCRVHTSWISATAYLVSDVHTPDSKSQWLLTAAHNLISVLPWTCDKQGLITDAETPCVTAADAIMIAVGWGAETHFGWVDKVAIMSGYFNVESGEPTRQRFDGAALHIGDSSIPGDFWKKAPSIGTVISQHLQAKSIEGSSTFVCPGFPGMLNEYQDLAGLYIAGMHSEGGGYGYGDFNPVALKVLPILGKLESKQPNEEKDEKENKEDAKFQGCLTWNYKECYVVSGQSGSPCVVVFKGKPYIVASVATDGVGAPFAPKEFPVAVDPIGLLSAIGASAEKLVLQVVPLQG